MNKYLALVPAAILACSAPAFSQSTQAPPADNSKVNAMSSHTEASSDAQKNSADDIDLTRRIRKSVMADKALSTYAHNVKIVSVNGTVTLNGPVRSEAEKASIQEKATAVAGDKRVVNQITVAPKS